MSTQRVGAGQGLSAHGQRTGVPPSLPVRVGSRVASRGIVGVDRGQGIGKSEWGGGRGTRAEPPVAGTTRVPGSCARLVPGGRSRTGAFEVGAGQRCRATEVTVSAVRGDETHSCRDLERPSGARHSRQLVGARRL